jgi:hypothetical protein
LLYVERASPFLIVIVLCVIIVALDKRDIRRARLTSLKAIDKEYQPSDNNQTGAENRPPKDRSPHADGEQSAPIGGAKPESLSTLILTLVAVVGAIASAHFASQAVDQTTIAATAAINQSRTMDDTEKRQLRPYVNITVGGLYNSAPPGTAPEWHLPIGVENDGATQTKGAVSELWCVPVYFVGDDPMKSASGGADQEIFRS